MKRVLLYTLFCLLILSSAIGCKKEEAPVVETATLVDITVKNTAGSTVAGTNVHLFKLPSTETGGRNITNALKTVASDANGVAKFNLKEIPGLRNEGTVYFTVLDQSASGVAGSVAVAYKKGESSAKDLVIQDPPGNSGGGGTNASYKHGYLPTTVTTDLAMKEYTRWRNTQVVACSDGLRVVADPANQTFVEGIGFGMMLSAYAKDKETFDGLHKFYNSKRTPQAKNMMGWKVTCSGIVDPGSATDGDIDVAFALLVASKQWGEPYMVAAKEIIQLVRDNLIITCAVDGRNIKILAPGYSGVAWGGCGMTDIMYHTPAFFRVFATVTEDNIWTQLADDTYTLLNAGAHPTTGLVPDWQTATGTPGPGGRAGHFGYDACRAPWKLTLDYLWYGNDKAAAWSQKISGWAEQVGPANIVDGYELNGRPRGTNGLNSAFLGGFAVASMSHSQARVDKFGTELSKLNDSYWFNLNTRCLYLFTLTGNFWNPLEK